MFVHTAVVGLGEGEPCDEINEERYCGHRLVCLKQQGSAVSTCVKNVAYVTLPNTSESVTHGFDMKCFAKT